MAGYYDLLIKVVIMVDVIDKANADYQHWLDKQIEKCRLQANDDVDCIDCGQLIGKIRKQVVPSAIRCIDCQQMWEQKS